ncbi:inositol-pentakisphosphate 2-kinase [Circinella umbellata]|nr:inositol-pentakisphosphate 2-kinase [Circinella umbellata]
MNSNHWIYLTEGNQTIVLKYIGEDPTYLGHILRVQKNKAIDARFQPLFINDIIGDLLGHEYIVPLKCIPITLTFLKAIEIAINNDRPDHRRARTIDLNQTWACIGPDLTFNSLLTVEIKPKWGFKPMSLYIQEKYKTIKAMQCRFCMHTWYKHNRSDMNYCPLDLYSMNPSRMKRALKALENEPMHDKLHINHYYPHDNNSHNYSSKLPMATDILDIITLILYQEPLLPRLKMLQRDLDQLNIEGIFPIYKKLLEQDQIELPMYDIDIWQQVVQEFKERNKSLFFSGQQMTSRMERQLIYEHVISAILKDCSIYISITRNNDDDSNRLLFFFFAIIYIYISYYPVRKDVCQGIKGRK